MMVCGVGELLSKFFVKGRHICPKTGSREVRKFSPVEGLKDHPCSTAYKS